MITFAALASIALIVAASEVVAHGLARVPGLGVEAVPRYTVTGTGREQLAYGSRP